MIFFYFLFFLLAGVLAQKMSPCCDTRNVTCTGYDSAVVASRKVLFVHEIAPGKQATVSFTGNTIYFQVCNNNGSMAITPNGFADPAPLACGMYGCGYIYNGEFYNVPPTNYGNGTEFNIILECVYTSPAVSTTTTTTTTTNPPNIAGNGNNRQESSSAWILSSVF
jgi:hypothetical protein